MMKQIKENQTTTTYLLSSSSACQSNSVSSSSSISLSCSPKESNNALSNGSAGDFPFLSESDSASSHLPPKSAFKRTEPKENIFNSTSMPQIGHSNKKLVNNALTAGKKSDSSELLDTRPAVMIQEYE
mgnify:CR=1 FL=1